MPDFKVEVRARVAKLGLSPVRDEEIVEELSQHLEEEYERALSSGASEDEARQQALEQLNAPDLLGRELKHVERQAPPHLVTLGTEQKINLFADLWQDLRYGLRMLAKNPAFTSIAIIAIALGIGANSVIFSAVDAVLLRPLPFKNPEQLVMIWENATHLGFPRDTPSPANFLDWQKQATSFTGMAAMTERSFNLTGVGEPERLDGRRVSANLFDLLGYQRCLGSGGIPSDARISKSTVWDQRDRSNHLHWHLTGAARSRDPRQLRSCASCNEGRPHRRFTRAVELLFLMAFLTLNQLPFVGMSYEFVGETQEAPFSAYIVAAKPGQGPPLHTHPYVEVAFTLEGCAAITVGDETREVKSGGIVVIPANAPHRFVNSGDTILRQIDIHASPRFIQTNLT